MAFYDTLPSLLFRTGAILSLMTAAVWTQTERPKGKSMNVSSYLAEPFLMPVEPIDGAVGPEYEGYIRDLLDELSEITDTEYIIQVNEDNHPGKMGKSWGGVIGDVTSGKAQMGAGPITETKERRKHVEFSTPFMSFGPVVIMKRPVNELRSCGHHEKTCEGSPPSTGQITTPFQPF
ncbi:hypothetical protein EGW08_007284, partial [Elysia chlorotica]